MKAFATNALLLSLSLQTQSVRASYNAYIYYTDAQCSDSTTISGTFNMAYDNAMLEGFGVQDDYVGDCIYFTEGYIDIMSGSALDEMVEGYCVECNEVVGCSPTQSCDDIKTGLPQNQQLYLMSNEGGHTSNKYQSAPTESELEAAQDTDNAALMKLEFEGYKQANSSRAMFAPVGTVVVLSVLVSLVVVVKQFRKKLTRKQTNNVSMSENFAPGSAFA